jgi:hypothetical protein
MRRYVGGAQQDGGDGDVGGRCGGNVYNGIGAYVSNAAVRDEALADDADEKGGEGPQEQGGVERGGGKPGGDVACRGGRGGCGGVRGRGRSSHVDGIAHAVAADICSRHAQCAAATACCGCCRVLLLRRRRHHWQRLGVTYRGGLHCSRCVQRCLVRFCNRVLL